MKIQNYIGYTIVLFNLICLPNLSFSQEVPKGVYMGEEPPGLTPVVFSRGFISSPDSEINSVFTPDGKEFYFAAHDRTKNIIMYTKMVDGEWIRPMTAPFSGIYGDVDISISYDGNRAFFGSDRPITPGGEKLIDGMNIWMVERANGEWSVPTHLKDGINSGNHQNYPITARNGNMYFQSVRTGNFSMEGPDIWMAEWKNGKYMDAVNLGENINTVYSEGDVLIAPDESWIIISAWGNPESYGTGDFYISFKNDDGSWQKRQQMGREINTEFIEFCPMLSPDGKYLFYSSKRTTRPYKADIYWVDIKIIEKYRK